MSTNIRALPTRRIDPQDEQGAAEKAVEAIRLLIRQELISIERERAQPEPEDRKELTVEQVAEIKNVKPRTVYDWVREGKVKCHRTAGGRLRFFRRDVES
jgi:excisionase family DNA binding protein